MQKKTADYPEYPKDWCLFGGHAESENLNKEIERELNEELGIKLKPRFIFSKIIDKSKEKEKFHIFSSELDDISKIRLGEGAGFAFFTLKELNKLNINLDTKLILKEYFKK